MSYDVKCHALATAFLSDFTIDEDRRAKVANEMAQRIQDTIQEVLDDEGLGL